METESEHFVSNLEDTYDPEYESAAGVFETEEVPMPSVLSLPHGDTLEAYARNKEILISSEAIQNLVKRAEGDLGEAKVLLDETASVIRGRYPREDGWLPINKIRVEEALGIHEVSRETTPTTEVPREVFEPRAPESFARPSVHEQQSGTSVDVFVEWIVNGDSDKTFSFVRTMGRQGQSVKIFLSEAITLLDDAYRARTEGRSARSQAVSSMTAGLSLEDFEAIIEALTGAVDGSYRTPMTGVKVALARVSREKGLQNIPPHSAQRANQTLN